MTLPLDKPRTAMGLDKPRKVAAARTMDTTAARTVHSIDMDGMGFGLLSPLLGIMLIAGICVLAAVFSADRHEVRRDLPDAATSSIADGGFNRFSTGRAWPGPPINLSGRAVVARPPSDRRTPQPAARTAMPAEPGRETS